MKEKILRKMKKCLSEIIVFAMLITMIPSFPAMAEQGKTYTYEDLEIQYLVTSEWESGQNVEITVKNTGAESVFNWAFLYDAKGEITNIWNADIVEKEGNSYVIRNVNHNFEIASGQSVNFGYTLTPAENGFPEKFELCSKREQMESGYNVKMAVTESWDAGFKGEIVIENTSEQPLEAWDLTFDTNFVIDNLWDARIIENTDNHYKIASEMWTNPIPAGDSMKIGFVATKSEEAEAFVDGVILTSVLIDFDFNSNPIPAPDPEPIVKGNIDLSTDESEIPTDTGSKTVYFYARTEIEVPSITLYDKDTSQSVGILVDDGIFNDSGDDIKGDGVYTCKAELDISKEKEYRFYAQYSDMVSESVGISVYEGFTDQENGEMDEVDSVLADWMTSESFQQLSLEEKEKQGFSILNSLAQEGTEDFPYELIQKDTIYHDAFAHGFSFTYSCGVWGYVMLGECHNGCNGEKDSEQIFGINAAETTLKSTLSASIKSTNSAQVLCAFREEEKESRSLDYNQYKADWASRGLKTKLDKEATVSDLKNKLKGNKIIVLTMHGMTYTHTNSKNKTVSAPALCLREKVTKKKNKLYKTDLKKNRVAKFMDEGVEYYFVLPKLFSATYKKKELKGSVVFLNSCSGFGENSNKDYALAKALKKSGAEFIMGFHNSVYIGYSEGMLNKFVTSMMKGTTTKEAYVQCVNIYGVSDSEWFRNTFPNGQQDKDKTVAVPLWYGNLEYTLWKGGILKGSFEKQPDETEDVTLQDWMKEGDVRIIAKLGELMPVDGKYMAIITTGIGSAEDEYLNGESRSSLSQRFKIPVGTTTLTFSYNVVSEEPMEYVGSQYDDTFSAKIYDADGISFTEVVQESVNTSSWQSVSGIDFDGGDSTAYQTGWKKMEIDVSSYAGKDVILSFDVCDKGDSAYDTAVLIDNVRLQGGN